MRSRRSVRVSACALWLILCCSLVASAQQTPPLTNSPDAEPYEDDEFPRWALDLRRAEIVAFGSLPLTLLASRMLYAIGRYAIASVRAGESDPAYLPPAFAPPGAIAFTRSDGVRIVIGAAVLSTTVALVDYVLGRRERTDGE